MKNSFLHSFISSAKTAGRAVLDVASSFIAWLPDASLPRILMLCVALALVSSILPLAFCLFVLFVFIKSFLLAGQAKQDESAPRQYAGHGNGSQEPGKE